MKTTRRSAIALLTVFALSAGLPAIGAAAGPSQRNTINIEEIQARIDRHTDNEDLQRRSIRSLLERSDVQNVAESAGLDVNRAAAAVATLSGSQLDAMAAQAAAFNALVGGSNVVLSTTAIIIVLLIIILLAG